MGSGVAQQANQKKAGIKNMAQREISERRMERLKAAFGWTEEQIRNLSPSQWKYLDNARKFAQYKMIAEVVKAEGCLSQAKEGDKFVISRGGLLLVNEWTFPNPCAFALGATSMGGFLSAAQERIAEGLDPNDICVNRVKCPDVGVECGGWGEVLFKIYFEKAAPSE